MNKYIVYYFEKEGIEVTKEVDANNLHELLMLLDAKYLYADQFQSIFKIELIK